MQAAATQRRESRETGPSLTRAFVRSTVVAALLLAFALGASPESRAQYRPSAGVLPLAPPRMAVGDARVYWGQRPAVSTGGARPLVHRPIEPSPRPCAPVLLSGSNREMNEGTTSSSLPLRPGSRATAVMLFVDFPDLHASESTHILYQHLVPRARRWFAEVSYGRLRLEVAPIKRWFRMPHPVRSYELADGISGPEQQAYLADAVAAADEAVDFSGHQILYVVAAKGTSVERSPAFHAYPGSGVKADRTELRYGATFFEDTKNDAGTAANVLIHETGHVLGLPDLYDVPDPSYRSGFRYVGGWDMMSSLDPGSHFLAWEKWKLGWLDPTQLACLERPGRLTATLTPLERPGGLKALVMPSGASTAFVVEARRRIGQDRGVCAEGVLVYSVDASVRSGYGPVRVNAAEPGRNSEVRARCGPLYNAPYARGPGRVARFEDASAGISLQVLGSGRAGYRVRVTRVGP